MDNFLPLFHSNRTQQKLIGCLLGFFIFITACTDAPTITPIVLSDISWSTYRNEQYDYELRVPSYAQIEEREYNLGVAIWLEPEGMVKSLKDYRERGLVITHDRIWEDGCWSPVACMDPYDIYSCSDPGEIVVIADKTFTQKVAPFESCRGDCSFWTSYSKVGSSACVTLTFFVYTPNSRRTPDPVYFRPDEVALFEEIASSLAWDE